MRPMVSIIVPVYNAEQYLRRCVDSILNQEYTDFEVFLVTTAVRIPPVTSARNTATRTQESL